MKLMPNVADGQCIADPVGQVRNRLQGLGELDELGEAANKATGKAQIE
jgi:hypothetical protein